MSVTDFLIIWLLITVAGILLIVIIHLGIFNSIFETLKNAFIFIRNFFRSREPYSQQPTYTWYDHVHFTEPGEFSNSNSPVVIHVPVSENLQTPLIVENKIKEPIVVDTTNNIVPKVREEFF